MPGTYPRKVECSRGKPDRSTPVAAALGAVDALLHFHGKEGREIIVKLDDHFVRHPREPRPTVEKDELDKLLNDERPDLV